MGWDLGVLLDAAGLLGDEYGWRDRSHVTGVSDFGRYEHERGRRRARCRRRPRARGLAERPSSGRAGRLRPADRRCAVRVAGPRRSPRASRRRRPEADRARRRARGRLLPGVRRRLPRRLLAAPVVALQLRGRDGRAGRQRPAADRRRRRPRARRLGLAARRDAGGAHRAKDRRLLSDHQLGQLPRRDLRGGRACARAVQRRGRARRRAGSGASRGGGADRGRDFAALSRRRTRHELGRAHPHGNHPRARLPCRRDP